MTKSTIKWCLNSKGYKAPCATKNQIMKQKLIVVSRLWTKVPAFLKRESHKKNTTLICINNSAQKYQDWKMISLKKLRSKGLKSFKKINLNILLCQISLIKNSNIWHGMPQFKETTGNPETREKLRSRFSKKWEAKLVKWLILQMQVSNINLLSKIEKLTLGRNGIQKKRCNCFQARKLWLES